ncbi:hypothetical protein BD626DRAFT_550647 [Schizophyllum amplum]|uniref:Uncharacterized protein n=1 Tax=Schizophyllum amplum TaxID=97359 RepID=A0A550C1F5_9AGAR|nr:hypothetical protein BD626DRAFT_550647 [Auriculariopsis ampla]
MASRAAGLPSNPRSRSVGRAASQHRATPVEDYAPPAHLPRQRSIANIRPSRAERTAPPLPDHPPRTAWRRPPTASPRTSVDSSSSSGSSTFSGRGYASSRTSLEEDAAPYKTPAPTGSLRDRRIGDSAKPTSIAPPSERLWDTVANAATSLSSLTVNISQAWATGVATASGEVTPPGQESHLTRALKAYHLQKAKDRSDLPDWLFEEHERRGKPRRSASIDDEEPRREVAPAAPRRRNFAAADYSTPPSAARSYEAPPATRATERLRSIRDARRGAPTPPSKEERVYERPGPVERGYQDRNVGQQQGTSYRRGLPSRPGPQYM